MARIGKPNVPSRSARTPLVGGDFESFADLVRSVETPHLAFNYGTLIREVLAISDPTPLSDTTPVSGAEVRYAVREGMALDLSSVVLRRTELRSAGHPGRTGLAPLAHPRGRPPPVRPGTAPRARLVRHSRLDALHRSRHPHRRTVLPGAGAVGVQGPVVAVHGSLRPPVLGTPPRVDGAHA